MARARIVTRFTSLREGGITVKKPSRRRKKRKKRRRNGPSLIPARCRDCDEIAHITRTALFDHASPARCHKCGGMLDATENVTPRYKGLVTGAHHTHPKPKPVDTSRSAGRLT